MALLVEAGAALRCEGSEDGNSSPPWAHVKISSLTVFAKAEYGAKIIANLLLFLLTVLSLCVVSLKMKHHTPFPNCTLSISNDKHSTVSLRLTVLYEAVDLSLSVSPSEVSQTPSSPGTTLACQAETDKY